MLALKGQARMFSPFLWPFPQRLSFQLHLLNTSLEAPQMAALNHLVKEDSGRRGTQQLQVIVETDQQPQPV